MKNLLPFVEYWLRPAPGFGLVQPALEALAERRWRRDGLPPPPRSVKATLIRRYAGAARGALVETGTYYGDMLAALRGDFQALHSIELSPRLARRARRRFAGDDAVTIHEGDSGVLLPAVLRGLGRPAVLWLDGHYSGPLTARGAVDTPLLAELEAALALGTADDVILIDDARLLGTPPYPSSAEVERLVAARRPEWSVHLESDVLVAHRP